MPRNKKIVYKKFDSGCTEPVEKERNIDCSYAEKETEINYKFANNIEERTERLGNY